MSKTHTLAAVAIALLFAVSISAHYWYKAQRDNARAEVASACIEKGGSFHTSFFLGRPRCKLPKER